MDEENNVRNLATVNIFIYIISIIYIHYPIIFISIIYIHYAIIYISIIYIHYAIILIYIYHDNIEHFIFICFF